MENSKPRILVIGDAMQDVYVLGTAERLSPEAPIPVFKPTQEIALPGGAANVEANLIALGAETSLLSGCYEAIKTRYMVGDHQLLRVDDEEPSEPVNTLWIKQEGAWAEAVVISDYGKGSITPEVIAAVRKLEVPIFIDTKRNPTMFPMGASAMFFPNDKEYRQYQDEYDRCMYVIHKRGKDGVDVWFNKRLKSHYPSMAKFVRSANGAGDVVLAAFVYCYTALPEELGLAYCAQFAMAAAAIAVEKPLTSTVTREEVEARLKEVRLAA